MRVRVTLLFLCAALALPWRAEAARPTPTPTPPATGRIEGMADIAPYLFPDPNPYSPPGQDPNLPPPPRGAPAVGWDVLLGKGCTFVAKTRADAQGIYRFDGLEPGEYFVGLSFDQPLGQDWRLLMPSINYCNLKDSAIAVAAGQVAQGPHFLVELLARPRGFFGSMFNDLNENGIRDPGEPGFFAPLSQHWGGDVSLGLEPDLEGNFRSVDTADPYPEIPYQPLEMTACTARPEPPVGYRITAPSPVPCGPNGCVTKVSEQLFQCQDFGLHLVDAQGAHFGGNVWRNAAPVTPGSTITARVGNTVCGQGFVWDSYRGTAYEVMVRSAQARNGCGTDGAEVHFSLGGEEIPTVGYWHTGRQELELVIGPSFAQFEGAVRQPLPLVGPCRDELVQAYIGDVLCGEAVAVAAYGGWDDPRFTLVVLPEALRPGCGREGDVVRFTVDGRPAPETATWTSGRRYFWLSAPLLEVPNTGSGGEHRDGGDTILTAALMLSIAGLALSLGGLVLRRR